MDNKSFAVVTQINAYQSDQGSDYENFKIVDSSGNPLQFAQSNDAQVEVTINGETELKEPITDFNIYYRDSIKTWILSFTTDISNGGGINIFPITIYRKTTIDYPIENYESREDITKDNLNNSFLQLFLKLQEFNFNLADGLSYDVLNSALQPGTGIEIIKNESTNTFTFNLKTDSDGTPTNIASWAINGNSTNIPLNKVLSALAEGVEPSSLKGNNATIPLNKIPNEVYKGNVNSILNLIAPFARNNNTDKIPKQKTSLDFSLGLLEGVTSVSTVEDISITPENFLKYFVVGGNLYRLQRITKNNEQTGVSTPVVEVSNIKVLKTDPNATDDVSDLENNTIQFFINPLGGGFYKFKSSNSTRHIVNPFKDGDLTGNFIGVFINKNEGTTNCTNTNDYFVASNESKLYRATGNQSLGTNWSYQLRRIGSLAAPKIPRIVKCNTLGAPENVYIQLQRSVQSPTWLSTEAYTRARLGYEANGSTSYKSNIWPRWATSINAELSNIYIYGESGPSSIETKSNTGLIFNNTDRFNAGNPTPNFYSTINDVPEGIVFGIKDGWTGIFKVKWFFQGMSDNASNNVNSNVSDVNLMKIKNNSSEENEIVYRTKSRNIYYEQFNEGETIVRVNPDDKFYFWIVGAQGTTTNANPISSTRGIAGWMSWEYYPE